MCDQLCRRPQRRQEAADFVLIGEESRQFAPQVGMAGHHLLWIRRLAGIDVLQVGKDCIQQILITLGKGPAFG
jgi:hypothetical protein